MLQALGWFVLAFTASSTSAMPTTPFPKEALLIVGALFLAGLSALPMGAVLSRYPRRRWREAVVFQAALIVICAAAFAGHPSVASALLSLWPLAVIVLLASPATRQFVSRREGRFTALQG